MRETLLSLFSRTRKEENNNGNKEPRASNIRETCNLDEIIYSYTIGNIEYAIVKENFKYKYCVIEEISEEYVKTKEASGYGILYPLIVDEKIEEISVNGVGRPIYVINKLLPGLWLESNLSIRTEEELDSLAYNISVRSRKTPSLLNPLVEGLTMDGYRISVTYSHEVSKWGSTIVLRKFPSNPLTITELIEQGVMSTLMAAYLWFLIDHKKFILITGGMGSGKTTILNALLGLVSPYYKVLTIEDTPEIRLENRLWDPLITRPAYGGQDHYEIDLFQLVKFSLRRRADYIVLGEVRGKEAYGLAQAAATGQGVITTFHAESPTSAIHRLRMDPISLPESFIRLVTCIVHLKRITRGGYTFGRKVAKISEQADGELVDLFTWDSRGDYFDPDGLEDLLRNSYTVREIMEGDGFSITDIVADFTRRIRFLELNRGIRGREYLDKIKEFYTSQIDL